MRVSTRMPTMPRSRTLSHRLAGAASFLLLAACHHDSTTAPSPVVTTISVAGGDAQTILAGAATTTPLALKVVDATGAPLSGIVVAWTLVSGGGALSATSST